MMWLHAGHDKICTRISNGYNKNLILFFTVVKHKVTITLFELNLLVRYVIHVYRFFLPNEDKLRGEYFPFVPRRFRPYWFRFKDVLFCF